MKNFTRNTCIFTFLLIAILEFLSYCGSLIPPVNTAVFFTILIIALFASLKKLEYGVYMILAELFIGSKGYLFYFEQGDFVLSIRIALYLVILAVWLLHVFKKKQFNFWKLPYKKWYIILFIFLAWGAVWGLIRGHSYNNVFFDANAWLYFALIFVLLDAITNKEQLKKIWQIFLACLLIISLKSFLVLFIYSHSLWTGMVTIYPWIRDTGVGEIAQMPYNFTRVFFQSQIYSLIGFFILLPLFLFQVFKDKNEFSLKRKNAWRWLVISSFTLSTILLSFSRSFWLGLIVSFAVLYFFLFFIIKKKNGQIIYASLSLAGILIVSIGLLYAVINAPLPKFGKGGGFSASLIAKRASQVTDEAAVSSRWSLLPELGKKIMEHPIIGSGFGATVTYIAYDPRIVLSNPTGEYTTYAFEWGFLDIMLKIGLAGLAVYLILIYKILWSGSKIIKKEGWSSPESWLMFGLLLGLVALFVTNGVSPYLNHPLGIGYLIILTAVFHIYEREKMKPIFNC